MRKKIQLVFFSYIRWWHSITIRESLKAQKYKGGRAKMYPCNQSMNETEIENRRTKCLYSRPRPLRNNNNRTGRHFSFQSTTSFGQHSDTKLDKNDK